MIITLSAIAAGLMFFVAKYNLNKHYFTQCEPCQTLHLSFIVYLAYLLTYNYGVVIEPFLNVNPFSIWLVAYVGYRFLRS